MIKDSGFKQLKFTWTPTASFSICAKSLNFDTIIHVSLRPYGVIPSCKKSRKYLERFRRKTID